MLGKEPTVILNALAEVVRAVIPMLLVFGFITWTDQQIGAVMLVVSVVVGALATVLTRQQTVSMVVADKQIEVAKASDVNRSTESIIAQAAKETK